MKTISIFYDDSGDGEREFFFDGDKFVAVINFDDSNYRDEYMNPVLEHFGVKTKRLKVLNKKQIANLKRETNITLD